LEADRRAARGQRMPRIDGFADGGRIGRKINETDTTWDIGVQLTIPLLDRDRYQVEIADRRLAQQRLRFDDLGQSIDAEVRDALIQLQTGRAVLGSTLDERKLAEREVTEARDRFTAGAGGNLDLIDAQRGLTRAQEQMVAARQMVALAQVRLARAVGAAVSLH
ncbi:MAG: TolC family protein, partial [Planctomycetes bacterium]|nr:TolC family protein [Planctomycetota bacterium]